MFAEILAIVLYCKVNSNLWAKNLFSTAEYTIEYIIQIVDKKVHKQQTILMHFSAESQTSKYGANYNW